MVMMKFESYDWTWLERGGKRILSIIFKSELRVSNWKRIYSEALADFGPDNLRILVDIRLEGSVIGREGFIELLGLARSLGARSIAVAMIVDDPAYELKRKMLEETAIRMSDKVIIESFSNTEDAEQWLLAIDFIGM